MVRICLMLCFVVLSGSFYGKNLSKVDASTVYKELFRDYETSTVKDGSYKFQRRGTLPDAVVYIKKGKGAYKKTPLPSSGVWSNGKQAVYIRDGALYKYVYSKRKEVRLKKLSASMADGCYVSAGYDNQIFVTRGSFDDWKYWTYRYNLKTGSWKMVKSNCAICAQSGKYVVAQNEFRSDVSPYPITVYKITSSGLKKERKLTSKGFAPTYVGSKLYYVSYTDESMKTCRLYRCNANGSKKKMLKKFTAPGEWGCVYVTDITSKSCRVIMNFSEEYKYTYATGKMKKLRDL